MRAALKVVNIDPKIGAEMGGFTERSHGCTGIHDSIEARALAFDDGKKKSVLVVCDVIGIDLVVLEEVRNNIIKEVPGIEASEIMVTATHTHSSVFACRLNGTNTNRSNEFDKEANELYYKQFIEKVSGVAIWALNNLKPVKLGFGKGEIHKLGANRNNKDGFYDPTVNILKIVDEYDEVIGLLVNYACHPTILNHTNYQISADYPGYLRKQLKQIFPKSETIFMQGAAGNISTRFTKKEASYEEAERLASILTGEVLKQVAIIESTGELSIRGAVADLELEVKDFPSDEEGNAGIEKYRNLLKEQEENGTEPSEIRKTYVTLQGLERNMKAKERIQFKKVHTQMQCLSLGVFTIIGIPGDVFAEIGMRAKERSTFPNTIVAGYANDFVGYIVSQEGYTEENYERYMSILDERAESKVLECTESLVQQLNTMLGV